jgi:AcrR family transcriptional regulator
MSQGNVYWYFKSKEDVLRAVLEEGFTAIGAIAQEVAALPGAGQDKLDALIERYLALYREQSEFPVILLSLMAHGGTPFLQTLGFDMLQIGTGYHQHMSGILAQARAEGIVADLEPDLLVVFFYAFFNGLMMTYRDMLPVIPPALIHAAVIRLLGGHVTR